MHSVTSKENDGIRGWLKYFKRCVKMAVINKWDARWISSARRSKIVQYTDPRRVAIFSEITLTPHAYNFRASSIKYLT